MSLRCDLLRSVISGLLLAALSAPVSTASLLSDKSAASSVLRWAQGEPGCTFSADDDGKYRYGLWAADFGVVVAIDAQEVGKMRRRVEPIFALFITVRSRSDKPMEMSRNGMSLEFVKHYHDQQSALDPDTLAATLQKDTDAFAEQTQREVRKHPEKSATLEAELKDRREDLAAMQNFLKTQSLRTVTLQPDHPEVAGWIFFTGKSKWVGEDWKKQEEFVLRIPLGGRVVEFPFALPPSEGDLLLRRRPNQ